MFHSPDVVYSTNTSKNDVKSVKPTSRAARIIVVSCERSPHSARKVRVRAWMKMGEMKLCHFP